MNASKTPPTRLLEQELNAAMEWWRDAGVDIDFEDDVTAWLQTHETLSANTQESEPSQRPQSRLLQRDPTPAPTAQSQTPRINFFAEGMPKTLEEFREFWLTSSGIDAIGPRGRVPPRGASGAELMVLIVDPEQSDTEQLLSGPQGRLLQRILASIGHSADDVYFASALPRHTPMADTASFAAKGMDAVLAHHIALAAPKRLIAFGAALTPLLGDDPSTRDSSSKEVNYSSSRPRTLLSEGLDSLMAMPRLKARFWRRWIEWSAVP